MLYRSRLSRRLAKDSKKSQNTTSKKSIYKCSNYNKQGLHRLATKITTKKWSERRSRALITGLMNCSLMKLCQKELLFWTVTISRTKLVNLSFKPITKYSSSKKVNCAHISSLLSLRNQITSTPSRHRVKTTRVRVTFSTTASRTSTQRLNKRCRHLKIAIVRPYLILTTPSALHSRLREIK